MFRMLKSNCLSYKKEQFPADTTVISVANHVIREWSIPQKNGGLMYRFEFKLLCSTFNIIKRSPKYMFDIWTKDKFFTNGFYLEAIAKTFPHVCSYQQCSGQFHKLLSNLQTAINLRYFRRILRYRNTTTCISFL